MFLLMIRRASAISLALFVALVLYRLQKRFVEEQVRIALQNRDTSERNWKGGKNHKGDDSQKGSHNQKGDRNQKGSQDEKGDPHQKGSQKQKGYCRNEKDGQNQNQNRSKKGPQTPADRDQKLGYCVNPSPLTVLRFEFNNVDHHFEVQEPGVYIRVKSDRAQYFCSKDWVRVTELEYCDSYWQYYNFIAGTNGKLSCVAVFTGIPQEIMRYILIAWMVPNPGRLKEFVLLRGTFNNGFVLKSFQSSDLADGDRVLL